MSEKAPVWRQFFNLKKNSPLLFHILIFYIGIEIVALTAPFFLPGHWYLHTYLSDKVIEKTILFFHYENSLIPDEQTGWKNNPGFQRGNWVIDKHGARSTHEFSFKKTGKIRVLFLGSSMINGGSRITNQETISANIEDDDIESLNFATMMYSLDQVLLDYRDRLFKYNSDIVFAGIDVEPTDGLGSHYVPFRYPQEENMPYVKPRFCLKGDDIELIVISPEKFLSDLPCNQDMLDFLSENDRFYYKFRLYCHMGLMPVSNGIRQLTQKTLNLARYYRMDYEGEKLLEMLMHEIVYESEKHHSRVIFLMNINRNELMREGIREYLPDLHGKRISHLRSAGFLIVDLREILRNNVKKGSLFAPDQSHYSELSNRIIADALRPIVKETMKDIWNATEQSGDN